jgi:hypothetical protein
LAKKSSGTISFIDLFSKLLKSEERTQDVTASEEVGLVRTSVGKRVSFIYPRCETLCKSILLEVEEARKAAKVVTDGKLESENIHYQIGLQMQKQFAARIPLALNKVSLPTAKDYDSFTIFHASSVEMLATVSKITSDNRYLPMFLGKEMTVFGKHMNEIVKLTEDLGSRLGSEKEMVGHLKQAEQLEKDLHTFNKELSSIKQLKDEIIEQKESLDVEISSALSKNKELEQEKDTIRKRIGEINTKISANEKEITEVLSPFQRQFRKMQKLVVEKKDIGALDSYTDNPENAIVEEVERSGDYPSLRKILERMAKALEKGELETDAKIRARRLDSIKVVLDGSLVDPAKQLISLKEELAGEKKSLDGVSHKMIRIEELQQKIEQNTDKITKAEKNEADVKKRMEEAVLGLESVAEAATGKAVRISRESLLN